MDNVDAATATFDAYTRVMQGMFDADSRAAQRERARLDAHAAKWDQRDDVRDDDHAA